MDKRIRVTITPEFDYAIPLDFDDAETLAEVKRRLADGDVWAWCCVEVKVQIDEMEAVTYLGGCSYADEADFRAGCYCDDLVAECIDQIRTDAQAALYIIEQAGV